MAGLGKDASVLGPMFVVRGLPIGAAVLLVVAFFLKTGTVHGACVGGALGLLVGYCAYSFSIKSVVLKETEQPADVGRYRVT